MSSDRSYQAKPPSLYVMLKGNGEIRRNVNPTAYTQIDIDDALVVIAQNDQGNLWVVKSKLSQFEAGGVPVQGFIGIGETDALINRHILMFCSLVAEPQRKDEITLRGLNLDMIQWVKTPNLDKVTASVGFGAFRTWAERCRGRLGCAKDTQEELDIIADMLAYAYRVGLQEEDCRPGLANRIGRLP